MDVSRRELESSSGAGATVEEDDEIHLRDLGTVVTPNWIEDSQLICKSKDDLDRLRLQYDLQAELGAGKVPASVPGGR